MGSGKGWSCKSCGSRNGGGLSSSSIGPTKQANRRNQVDIKAIAICLQEGKSPMLEAKVIAENISLLAMMFGSCSFSYGHKSVDRF